mmetsp:Transcript_132931/g.413304  ORF Transcript_132931/g.413304 Transcript_132931/m.413304 type:complete len:515 (-) Transcript_132931:86-1630(-)
MVTSAASGAKHGYGSVSDGLLDSAKSLFHAEEDSDPEDRMSERNISWQSAAWVINASVIGMGVLTIPSCFATLGWLCGMVALVVCLFANVLVAHIMMEVQALHPNAISLADAAQVASGGSRTVKVVIRNVLYTEKLACTCAFMNLMADTLGSAFYSVHWCEVTWVGLLIIIFFPLMQLKNLHETFFLNVVNFVTILGVVALTCVDVATSPTTSRAPTSWHPVAHDFQTAFGSISMMVFAYSGNWMYFELMAEMREPGKFLKSFTIAGPTQVGLYALIAGICYGFMGSAVPASVVEGLRFGPLMRTISFLLALHVICGTGTNLIILIRFFHSRVSPKTLNEESTRANVIRTAIYLIIICSTCVVSLSVNNFGAIVSLIGALFEAPINFVLPFLIYAGVMRGQPRSRTWSNCFVLLGAGLIAAFGLVTMVMGVSNALPKLGGSSASPGGLLACNCQGLWDTCQCSPERMPSGACLADGSGRATTLTASMRWPSSFEEHMVMQQPWLPLYPHHLEHH